MSLHFICKAILSSFLIWFLSFHLWIIACRISSLLCNSHQSLKLLISLRIVFWDVRTWGKTRFLSFLLLSLSLKSLLCFLLKTVFRVICKLLLERILNNHFSFFLLLFCKLGSFFTLLWNFFDLFLLFIIEWWTFLRRIKLLS